MTSMESRPAFSAMVLGITSRALAKEFIINWVLPAMERAWCLKYLSIRNTPFIYLDSSISMAPPPETMAENRKIAGIRSEASQLIDVLFREEKSTFDRIEGNADAAKDWIQSFQNRRGAKIFLSCWSDQEHQ